MTTDPARTPRDSLFEQAHVKRFITEEILGKLDFNEHSSAGAHAHFVARGAKAAGLSVRKIGTGYFFFQGKKCIGTVDLMVPSLVSHAALKAGQSKQLTKELLTGVGVPVPRGRMFVESDLIRGTRFFQALKVPVVVKPNGGRGGRDCRTNR